jgi:structure-specific recognition protein 1
LEFEVENKLSFEVPLSHVSHTTTAKQEVTLEFHPNDDAAVSLMELRFHIPPDPKDNEKDLVQVGP